MIFIGDIAVPKGIVPKMPKDIGHLFSSPVVANFEGAIAENNEVRNNDSIIYNTKKAIDYLLKLNIKVVTLANNHIMDLTRSANYTICSLEGKGIITCGAGETIGEASRPAILKDDGATIVFIGFGWEAIQCLSAGEKTPGVNPLRPRHLLESVCRTREMYKNSKIILLLHWNYELELYPQPMDRELAFAAVDSGADVIIGCHSHCVQGIEMYRNAPIVYGLGNWFLPHGIYFNGKLKFPEFSNRQLAFEYDYRNSKMNCHWFKYIPEYHEVIYLKSENLSESTWINELTPFVEMNHSEYKVWFKRNRRKRCLLPIYKDYRNVYRNSIKNEWIYFRQFLISLALRIGLKGGPK